MSKIFVIFSYFTRKELKKVNYLLLADELHEEDLAVRLDDILEDRESAISLTPNEDFGDSRGGSNNSCTEIYTKK